MFLPVFTVEKIQ